MLHIIFAAMLTFVSIMLVLSHLGPVWMRRVVGRKGLADLVLHTTILTLFLGTSTMGLLQAEAAGICLSIFLRLYYKFVGHEQYNRKTKKWVRTFGPLGTYKLFN